MDTIEIGVLAFGLFLKMALAVVALTIVYSSRLPASKRSRRLSHEGGRSNVVALEERAESRPVPKGSPEGRITKPSVPVREKPLVPVPVANKDTQPAGNIGNAGKGEIKKIKIADIAAKAGGQIAPIVMQKGDQSTSSHPTKRLVPKGPLKPYSTSYHQSISGTPQEQPAAAERKTGEKPPLEPVGASAAGGEKPESSITGETDQIQKNESEPRADAGSVTDDNQEDSGQPDETKDSNDTDEETSQGNKSGLGDFADLFATSASEFMEKNKLAEEVSDIDINEILQEGLGLLGKVNKPDS